MTPGGAQDIGLARDKIASGQVPNPEDWSVEGMLSEHDLPLEGPPCDRTLCVAAGVGLENSFESGTREAFAQVGFSSNIDLSRFHRRALNLAAVVDVSGSMAGEKLASTKVALKKLIEQLNGDDLFTLVIFDTSADTLVPPTAVTNRAALESVVDSLAVRGGTCIECGMKEGYRNLEPRHSEARDSRLVLFTDAMPNVGATGEGEFTDLVRQHQERIGITAFGVGLDFGQALALAISSTRGGNYFFLESAEKIQRVFDEDFDLLVTPVAYDLTLTIQPGAGFTVADVYGVPGWKAGDPSAGMHVPTLFLSRNRGAILVRLTGEPQANGAMVSLSGGYQEASGQSQELSLAIYFEGATPLPEGEMWFSQGGIRKTVALTNFVLGARKACELWEAARQGEALTTMQGVRDYIRAEATALGEADVETEAELADKLLQLMGG